MQYKVVSFKFYWLIWSIFYSGLIVLLVHGKVSDKAFLGFLAAYWLFCMTISVIYGRPLDNYIKQNIDDKFIFGWYFILISPKDFNDPNVRILKTNLRRALLFPFFSLVMILIFVIVHFSIIR